MKLPDCGVTVTWHCLCGKTAEHDICEWPDGWLEVNRSYWETKVFCSEDCLLVYLVQCAAKNGEIGDDEP